MDGSSLPENACPTAGRGVAEEAPWRVRGLKDGIPALADPLQGMGDTAKNEGVCASRVRRLPSPRLGAGAAPGVGAGLFLAQAAPMLLVLEAAEQHLIQSHREVLLVCRVQDKACQWRGRGKGLAHRGPLFSLAPGPS